MKLIDIYGDIQFGELGDDTYLRTFQEHPCCICGEPTQFIEINYEAPFCSTECEDVFYTIERIRREERNV